MYHLMFDTVWCEENQNKIHKQSIDYKYQSNQLDFFYPLQNQTRPPKAVIQLYLPPFIECWATSTFITEVDTSIVAVFRSIFNNVKIPKAFSIELGRRVGFENTTTILGVWNVVPFLFQFLLFLVFYICLVTSYFVWKSRSSHCYIYYPVPHTMLSPIIVNLILPIFLSNHYFVTLLYT